MIRIRPALPADADAIGTMHALAWAETYVGQVPEALLARMSDPVQRRAAWARNLAGPLMEGGTLLAEEGEEVVGFVSVCAARDKELGTSGEVAGIYLLRRAQRRGLGTVLLSRGLGLLQAAGHDSAGAWALNGNRAAATFYAARGAVAGAQRIERRGELALEETAWTWLNLAARP